MKKIVRSLCQRRHLILNYFRAQKLISISPLFLLTNLQGKADGGCPLAGVILDSAGNCFGTEQNERCEAGRHGPERAACPSQK
jgi:hypothetical protein